MTDAGRVRVVVPRSVMDEAAPRLSWPGRPRDVLVVETEPPVVRERWGEGEPLGRVILGDNLEALATLEPGSVRLCYLDPPFFSGAQYTHRARLGDAVFEVPAFGDTWDRGLTDYLEFLEDRLRLVSRALAEDGSLYVHLDAHAVHYVRVLLDEILGAEHFTREIVWRIGWVSGFKTRVQNWVRNHDVILYYARPGAPFHKTYLPHPEGYERRGGGEGEGRPIEDVWTDIDSIQVKSFSREKTGFATQKNLELLHRIIEASSDPGDTVLDPFGGAGSTAVAAAECGRRFVTIDQQRLAVHLTRRRLVDRETPFTVEGDAPEVTGPVEARVRWTLAGPVVELGGVPRAAGPEDAPPLSRIDSWWISELDAPDRPLWFVHRPVGRHPDPVRLESEPLGVAAGSTVRVDAVDLAGQRHVGTAQVPDKRSSTP